MMLGKQEQKEAFERWRFAWSLTRKDSMQIPWTALGIGFLLMFLPGCASSPQQEKEEAARERAFHFDGGAELAQRAAFDMHCPVAQMAAMVLEQTWSGLSQSAVSVGVRGCGHQATYIRSIDTRGAWVLNGGVIVDPTVRPPSPSPSLGQPDSMAQDPCGEGDFAGCLKQCDLGVAASCQQVARMYEHGKSVPRNISQMVHYYELTCRLRNAVGCIALGTRYVKGIDVPANPAKAVPLYEQACSLGDSLGCASLGGLYRMGLGVSQDLARANELFEKACKGGHAAACSVVQK